MKRLFRWMVWIPIGASIVLFLIANRAPVTLSFDPLSGAAATPALPLWLWLVLALLSGFALGALGMWMSGRELRVRARADRLELKAMKKSSSAPVDISPAEQL